MILARIVAPVARTAMMLKSRCNLARPLTSLLSQNCAMSPLSSNVAFIQNSSSPILPSTLARSIQTAPITRDIDSATKFISAGACNVLRIADLPILISRRFFSSESEYEKILKELKFKYGSQPDPEIILRDLAVEIRAKDDAVKTATELKIDLAELKIDLEFHVGLVAADISRCVLEKFVNDILKKYSSLKDQPSAREIKLSFTKFLNSSDPVAVEFKKMIPEDLLFEDLVEAGTDSFIKLSGVIHRAMDAFLDQHDVKKMYNILEKAPRLTDMEKKTIDIIAKFLYLQKKN